MKKSTKRVKKPTRGSVSIVGIETSAHKRPSSIEGRSDTIRGTTIEAVLEDLRIVVSKVGRFPSRMEYFEHGKLCHTMIVRIHGLRHLASLLNMESPKGGGKFKTVDESKKKYRCFNQELCVNTPPTKVSEKQTYCRPCKSARGWDTFRGEYND